MPAPPKPLTREQVISDIKDLGRVPMGLLDMLAGAAKGSVSATVGLPGDIESLVRLIPGLERQKNLSSLVTGQRETFLPTSEEVSQALPPVIPAGASPQRQASAQFGQEVGAFIPPPVSALGQASAQAGRTIGRGALQAGRAVAQDPSVGAAVERAVQRLAPAATPMYAIKPKGGNWLAGEVEGATEPLRSKTDPGLNKDWFISQINRTRERGLEPSREVLRHVDELTGLEAVDKWIDKKLNRYIKNEMATPEDPVRKLADQGITHVEINPAQVPFEKAAAVREQAGFPKQGYATTQPGKNWEGMTDYAILSTKAGEMGNPALWGSPQAFQSYMALNPWVAKAAKEAPETPIYEMAGRTHTLGFNHLIDELKNSIRPDSDLPANLRWKPEDLEKVTMEQAVRRVHDINEYRAAKKAEANEVLARNPATVTFKEYPAVPGSDKPNEKGLAWKEIRDPGAPEDVKIVNDGLYHIVMRGDEVLGKYASEKTAQGIAKKIGEQQLADALKYEGDVMGHCVGGYCDDVLSGRSKIYSLRDKKGEPHVTIEVERMPRRGFGPGEGPKTQPEDQALRFEWLEEVKSGKIGDDVTFAEWWRSKNGIPEPGPEFQITQIKGKANKAPKDEYLPFVQDFVRSGNWSRVGDIQNTGLKRKGDFIDEFTPDQLDSVGKGEYVTQAEIESLRKALKGKKEGGPVRISDNPDTMALELAIGGIVKGGKGLKEAAKAAEKAVPPKLPRAEPKTKAEIEAIAERIAPQVLGKYVRKSEESAVTAAGKTKKQFEREKELPVVLTGEAKTPSALDLTSLQGKALIGILGDPSITGRSLESVGDIRLGLPSPQHGGPLYGLGHEGEAFWASGKGAAKKVQNLADEVSKQYGTDVLGKYIMMGPEGLNYAQHFADANLQAIDLSKMTKRQIEEFNDLIRKGSPASGPRPSFPGIEDKGSAYLHFAMDPKLRIHFNALMQKPTVTEAFNLPSGQDIRFAITEPALRDLERGVTGMSIGEMRPGAALTRSEHPTYEMDIPGKFLGSSKYPIPYELMFPDTVKAIRANPKQAPHEFGSLGMVGPRQIIDQQLIDELRVFDEQMKKLTGKKEGGAVKMQVGGALKAAAKAAKAAKPEVLPAAEREANLARMLEASQVKSPLYHSSRSPDINTFYSWSHLGTKKAAEDRARQIMQTNPEGVTTYPVHALIKNPLRTEDLGLNQMGFWNLEKLIDSLDPQKVDFSKWSGGKKGLKADYATDQDPSIVEDFLRRNGYDSIVYKNQAEDPGSDSYIIFNPKNIKSATGNRGTFDVTRPEITKKRGGKVSITDNLDTMRLAVQKRK